MTGTLVFDGDCAFCTSSAAWLRAHVPAIHVVPWQRTDLDALGLTEAQCGRAVRWVGDDRSHAAGAGAIGRALGAGPLVWRAAGTVVLASRPLSSLAYWLVARNRHRLPGGTPACKVG